MKSTQRIMLIASTLLAFSTVLAGSVWADTLSEQKSQLQQKQKQAQQLQSKLNQTSHQIQNQKVKTKSLQHSLTQTQQALVQTKQNIVLNQHQQQALQVKITGLTKQIEQTQTQLDSDQQAVNSMLRASYEQGTVPYLYVLMQANSFSDLLGRLTLLATVAKSEKDLLNQVTVLHKKLNKERSDQRASLHELQLKGGQLYNMQQAEVTLTGQTKSSLTLVSQSINSLQQEEAQFSQEMHLTQQQEADLKQQIQQEEAIQATQSGNVVEADLQYHPVSAQKLYDFVQHWDTTNIGYPSDFSVADMQTIVQAGQNYNVNPILLVAITGAEESFVPTRYPAYYYWAGDVRYIHNNPFNVYYSWMWTRMNRPSWTLSTTANIAANTVRHKLSTPPPSGENVFDWLNDPHNPWGLYATDRAWAGHVRTFYYDISNYVNS